MPRTRKFLRSQCFRALRKLRKGCSQDRAGGKSHVATGIDEVYGVCLADTNFNICFQALTLDSR